MDHIDLPDGLMFVGTSYRNRTFIDHIGFHVGLHPLCGAALLRTETARKIAARRVKWICPACVRLAPEDVQIQVATAWLELAAQQDGTVVGGGVLTR